MTIKKLNIGSAPNDGTGQDLRSGGQIINDNFEELDTRTAAAQSKADNALPKSGGALSGPLASSSTIQTQSMRLSSTSGLLVDGGETHAQFAVAAVSSIAKNDNLVTETISVSPTAAFAPRYNLLRARGTVSSPSAVQDGDVLGGIQFLGHNGTTYTSSGYILSTVDGAVAGAASSRIDFATASASVVSIRWSIKSTGHFLPDSDNNYDLGSASRRARVVYAGTGAINTSDAREKTPVRALSGAEIEAAKQLAQEIGAYRFLSAIAEKGDAAREHIGMTVQRAIEIMDGHGLDPFAYGFICFDQWLAVNEVVDECGEVVSPARPAGDRYSFRTDELCLFIAAGFEARLSALETVHQPA